MSAKSNAPVLIKRKKVIAAGGHHGGAWKVAYADFVTAMMAFFMLMWLLNATTEKQRKGIADYFNPTIPVNRISGGGDGVFSGDSVYAQEALPQNGSGAAPAGGEAAAEAAKLAEIEKALSARSGESMASDRTLRHIVTRVTDEGLIIELFDLEDEPLFAEGSDRPEPVLEELAQVLADVFALVGNQVAVNGHVRPHPVVLADNPDWPLSSQRAAAMRELLFARGLPAPRMQRVSGFADRKPAAENPLAARNNRLEVILLRRQQD